jgi:hypothetical protein
MESRVVAALGKVAGLGGIAFGVFLLIFQGVLQKQFLPQAGLNSTQAFAVIFALMILTFGIAALGVVAWLVSRTKNPHAPISPHALGVLAVLITLVLGVALYVGAEARSGIEKSSENSITSVPNNTGIVTQGQTGNNIIMPFPAPEPEFARRNALLGRLRQEYIFSHDGLTSALLAGTEPVPADWMNKRLAKMGELWRVRVKGSEYEILPP